jgi:SecD/SecF fusion protein
MDLLSDFAFLAPLAQSDLAVSQSNAGESTLGPGSLLENLKSAGYLFGIIFAVFILPFLLGRSLASWLRMANYGAKFGLIIASIIGASLILYFQPLRYGPDINGGMYLVYELDKSSAASSKGPPVKAASLIPRLSQRLNPAGLMEMTIRPSGDDQIEIIVPKLDPNEVKALKQKLIDAGVLEFMVVANQTDHQDIIQLARKQSTSENATLRLTRDVKTATEGEETRRVGVWRAAAREDKAKEGIFPYLGVEPGDIIRDGKTGQIIEGGPGSSEALAFERWLKAKGVEDLDVLIALEKGGREYQRVTGDDLETARHSLGKNGYPEVEFSMKASGASRLQKLTYDIRPDPTSGFHRRMAILLDGRIISAPNLNQPISKDGVIQGRFSQEQVKYLVNILESGSLPATLNKIPIAENQVGATMGKDAISKAGWASIYALIATFVFVIVYYRFSGLVASVALVINLLLILAGMVLIQQPITLPGLAGIVLSIGMSFDANVLVFERIREEIAKKSTGRLAIRNGFERAWTTIFDSNFTTLITALVLYWLGTDQVRGFAVSLIIGLAISMFTAVFCSHVIFDICERLRIVNFSMADAIAFAKKSFLGDRDIDFMSMRKAAYVFSSILIIGGLIATFIRGREILDIDFNGGTSVTLSVDKPLEIEKVRNLIKEVFDKDASGSPIQTSLTSVSIEGMPENAVFKLDTSIQDVKELEDRLKKGFTEEKIGAALNSYEVKSGEPVEVKPTADAASAARTKRTLSLNSSAHEVPAKIDGKALLEKLVAASKMAGSEMVEAQFNAVPVDAPDWTPESLVGYSKWDVDMPADAATSQKIVDALAADLKSEPVWESINRIQSRVAGQMQQSAILALIVSLLFIIAYIWFRFQKVAWGVAAVVALVHDVLITLGFIAISHWLYQPLGALLIEDFKISLTTIAAFLTIIGYSLNDTIVVFDRIREVKGKSPKLTNEIINLSVNQTLGRTILTSSTTIIAILLLYTYGGEGVHGFCYSMLVGILIGTYSSIFVAAPVLVWLASKEKNVSRIGGS